MREWELERKIVLTRAEFDFLKKRADEKCMPLNTYLKLCLVQSFYEKSIAELCEEFGRMK